MGKVKVPGTDREVEFNLHEPCELDGHLISVIGREQQVDPEVLGRDFSKPTSWWLPQWSFSPPVAVLFKKDGYKENAARAARFQKARSLRGRPYSSFVSRVEDFAVLVLYFESLGFKQGTRQARLYWEKHGQITPLQNHIEKALKEVRLWVGPELASWVPLIRAKYRLTGVPKAARPKRHT